MSDLPQISGAEFEVMKLIWKHAPISTNELAEMLAEQWNPKTIHTLLIRLAKKGAVTYHKESRVFVYTPLIEEKAYLESESKTFLNRFFDGELNSMFLTFLEQDGLTDEELDQMQMALNQRKKTREE